MLWLIIGGLASGKSRFAEHLAASLGREGIYLSCETVPGHSDSSPPNRCLASSGQSAAFTWLHAEADGELVLKLRVINEESNLYRADSRVLVVDSLSGWLRGAIIRNEGKPINAAFNEIMDELLAYQGKLIVVSEEPSIGAIPDERAAWFAWRLADANRSLSERSRATYRLTAGIASEIKGYRVTRKGDGDENLYENRR